MPGGLSSDAMLDTMKYCVSCKACARECPTGVDMARMKIEVLSAKRKKDGLTLADKLIAYLRGYAPKAAKVDKHARRQFKHENPKERSIDGHDQRSCRGHGRYRCFKPQSDRVQKDQRQYESFKPAMIDDLLDGVTHNRSL